MWVILNIILLLSILGVVHTYLIYPWWVRRRAAERGCDDQPVGATIMTWPSVAILMAVHNEETVLPQKLDTLVAQDYAGELNIFLGSDCSTDATNEILAEFAATHPPLSYSTFAERQGKPGIINRLEQGAKAEVLVLTDASVMLQPSTVTELVLPMLADPRLGVVDATMVQTGAEVSGIGKIEAGYISSEVAVKRAEGCLWGTMIGPFGGCWAIRKEAFTPVPDNFLVDDFYLCLAAYERGWRGTSSTRAIVYEGVGQDIAGEFRRKSRIGAGNWQNLVRFRKLWWPCWRNPLAFAFFSHKILRWWTPLLLLAGAFSWAGLIALTGNYWAAILFVMAIMLPCWAVVLERVLSRYGIHCTRVRALTYFLAMNLALTVGLFRYLKGIRTNVWQPSNRN